MTVRTAYCFTHSRLEDKYEVGAIDLGTGEERRVDFEMPASVTVPVRFLTAQGAPVAGVEAGLPAPLGIRSDSEGRATLYGIDPYMTYTVSATRPLQDQSGCLFLGQSAPFQGKPGEVLPEITVVCRASGLLVGRLVAPIPVTEFPQFDIQYVVQYAGATDAFPGVGGCPVNRDGTFTIPEVGEGACSISIRVMTNNPDYQYWAEVEGVDVAADATTDLGEIALQSPPAPDFRWPGKGRRN
jgi:hypothetical protein